MGVAPPEIPLSSNDREFPTRMILVLVLLDVPTKIQLDILTLNAFLGNCKVRVGVIRVGKCVETCQNVNVKDFSTELLTSIPLRLLGHLYIASFWRWTCFASIGRYFSQICPLQRRVPLSGACDHSGCPAAGDLRDRELPAPLDEDEKERPLDVGWGDCAILLACSGGHVGFWKNAIYGPKRHRWLVCPTPRHWSCTQEAPVASAHYFNEYIG